MDKLSPLFSSAFMRRTTVVMPTAEAAPGRICPDFRDIVWNQKVADQTILKEELVKFLVPMLAQTLKCENIQNHDWQV